MHKLFVGVHDGQIVERPRSKIRQACPLPTVVAQPIKRDSRINDRNVPVLGTTSARNSNVTRPTSLPPTSISKYTIGLLASDMAKAEVRENARWLTTGVNAVVRRAATRNVDASMIDVVESVHFITRIFYRETYGVWLCWFVLTKIFHGISDLLLIGL